MKTVKAALLLTLASAAAWPQVNVGEQIPEASLPFTLTTVTPPSTRHVFVVRFRPGTSEVTEAYIQE